MSLWLKGAIIVDDDLLAILNPLPAIRVLEVEAEPRVRKDLAKIHLVRNGQEGGLTEGAPEIVRSQGEEVLAEGHGTTVGVEMVEGGQEAVQEGQRVLKRLLSHPFGP